MPPTASATQSNGQPQSQIGFHLRPRFRPYLSTDLPFNAIDGSYQVPPGKQDAQPGCAGVAVPGCMRFPLVAATRPPELTLSIGLVQVVTSPEPIPNVEFW